MSRPDGRAPDVLLVVADQWRGSDQGWAGQPEVVTPHLDALVETGVAVTGAVAGHPVCGPSRGSLLTGLLPHRHRVVANDLPLTEERGSLLDSLRASGYRTGWIGKWHLEGLPRDQGLPPGRRGLDWFTGVNCSHRYLDAHYFLGTERVDFAGYEPEVQTDLALAAFADRDDQPQFLAVSYGPPHDPYSDVPERYRERYDPAALTLPPTTPDTRDNRARLADYYAGITAIDTQLGRLVGALRDAGRLDSTCMIITSDHGDLLGAHGREAKQVPYAEAVRVPLVWHWPDGLAPRRIDDGFFGVVDLAPTLLDLVGAEPLPDTYGRSLAPALRGEGVLRSRALLGNLVSVDNGWRQGVGEWRGFVDEQWNYARHVDGSPWLLFDERADPHQQTNVVDDPGYAGALAAADAELDRLLIEAGDDEPSAETLLRRLDLVQLWNDRERALHGDQARLLEPAR